MAAFPVVACGGGSEAANEGDGDGSAGNNEGGEGESDAAGGGDGGPPKKGVAIVIGSGFGGAVSALRLGEAGVETIVLERGRRWDIKPTNDTFCENLSPDGRSAWLSTETVAPVAPFGQTKIDKYVGVLQRVDYENISIYMGAGVGGGSIPYGGMTVQPTEENFKKVFPSEIDYAELDKTYYPRVREMIGAKPIPDDLLNTDYYKFSRVFLEHAKNANLETIMVDQAYDWDIIRKERDGDVPKSALSGQLLYGNNNGAKNSLDHNYIPKAEKTGKVKVLTLHQVTSIAQSADGRYEVEIDRIDEKGTVVEKITLTCDYLFLAAGSYHTTQLLLKAKAKGTLPKLNGEIGRGWGTNGNAMFRRDLVGSTGTMQATPPVAAIKDFGNKIAPTLVECAQLPIGIDTFGLMSLACVLSPARGIFSYDKGKDELVLDWPQENNKLPRDAANDVAGRLNDANSGVTQAITIPGHGDLTYHPLGGAVLGKACDFFGRLHGYTNLYVVDSAMIPGSTACANPSLTIAAIAERNVERLIKEDSIT